MPKKQRTSRQSLGQRRNVSKWATKAVRRQRTPLQRVNAQVEAWMKGKNVVLTMPNSNPNDVKNPYVRKKATDVWGKYSGGFVIKTDGK